MHCLKPSNSQRHFIIHSPENDKVKTNTASLCQSFCLKKVIILFKPFVFEMRYVINDIFVFQSTG